MSVCLSGGLRGSSDLSLQNGSGPVGMYLIGVLQTQTHRAVVNIAMIGGIQEHLITPDPLIPFKSWTGWKIKAPLIIFP